MLEAILDILPHAIETLRGEVQDERAARCDRPPRQGDRTCRLTAAIRGSPRSRRWCLSADEAVASAATSCRRRSRDVGSSSTRSRRCGRCSARARDRRRLRSAGAGRRGRVGSRRASRHRADGRNRHGASSARPRGARPRRRHARDRCRHGAGDRGGVLRESAARVVLATTGDGERTRRHPCAAIYTHSMQEVLGQAIRRERFSLLAAIDELDPAHVTQVACEARHLANVNERAARRVVRAHSSYAAMW